MKLPGLILPPPVIQTIPEEESDDRRPLAPHLSFSQMSMYLRCSMQYYFRYVLKLREKPKVSMSLGKGGHGALEWNAKKKISTGVDRPTDEVVQKASDMMDHYLTDLPKSEYEKDVEPGEIKDKFLAATHVYMERDAPKIRPIGAEVEFNLDINEYLPEPLEHPIRVINGKIDLIYQDTATLLVEDPDIAAIGVEDEKFVARKRNQTEVNLSPQLTLYGRAVHKITGKYPSKLGYRLFHPGTKGRGKQPGDPPDSLLLVREPEHMTGPALAKRFARLAFQFAKVEEGIRRQVFIPVDDPMTCSWCGFRDRCQGTSIDEYTAMQIRAKTLPPE